MDSYATLEVCSSTSQSVDHISSVFTRSPSPGVYCFKGEGAGLNDPNGTERDATNTYLPGSHRCHVVWSNGVEVLAAKRPATTGYPARVDPKTPLLWRPVAQNLRIAN